MGKYIEDIIPEDKRILLKNTETAFVMKANKDFDYNNIEDREKSVCLYIPMLMNEMDMGNEAKTDTYTVNSSMIKNQNIKVEFDKNVTIKNYFTASPSRNSNTEQPPLAVGESVEIEFIDFDIKKARYTTKGSNEKNRTNDRARLFASDKVNKDQETKEYEMLMDSETQRIRIHMNDGRGEVSPYTMEFDGIKGFIRLNDEHHNEITISTKDKHVYMLNSDGTYIEIKGETATIKANGKITLDCPLVECTGKLNCKDTITSSKSILDSESNTQHHSHP